MQNLVIYLFVSYKTGCRALGTFYQHVFETHGQSQRVFKKTANHMQAYSMLFIVKTVKFLSVTIFTII